MKDIETLAIECMLEMDALNIKYGDVTNFQFAKIADYGHCVRKGKKFEITIAAWLANDDIPDKIVKDTLLHELIHTVEGCFNHGREFKHFAFLLNTKYGYTIQRVATDEEIKWHRKYEKPTYKYFIGCTKCNTKIGYKKLCESVKFPDRYNCSHCGAKIVRLV